MCVSKANQRTDMCVNSQSEGRSECQKPIRGQICVSKANQRPDLCVKSQSEARSDHDPPGGHTGGVHVPQQGGVVRTPASHDVIHVRVPTQR